MEIFRALKALSVFAAFQRCNLGQGESSQPLGYSTMIVAANFLRSGCVHNPPRCARANPVDDLTDSIAAEPSNSTDPNEAMAEIPIVH
jgi:hypothetical protein